MISTEEVFVDCRKLLGKDKAGYFSSDEFNRFSKSAEQMLWRFYVKHFEEHGVIADAMIPFNDLAVLSLDSNNRFSLPSDFGRRNILWWKKMTSVSGSEPIVELVKISYLEKEELQDTLDSAVRGPNLTKNRLYYSFVGGKAQVWPAIGGPVELDYLRNPVYGVRGYTVNVTTLEEDPASGSTVDYEWPENERPNLIDLILLQYGQVLRETNIIQFALAQQGEAKNHKQL